MDEEPTYTAADYVDPVREELKRQREKGYTVENDRKQGPLHMLDQIMFYANVDTEEADIKTMALVVAFHEAFPEIKEGD